MPQRLSLTDSKRGVLRHRTSGSMELSRTTASKELISHVLRQLRHSIARWIKILRKLRDQGGITTAKLSTLTALTSAG